MLGKALSLAAAGNAAPAGGYQISRSLRFNSADSAYLNRTPGSAGNRRTWTWSGWVKRSALPASGYYSFFGADSGAGTSFYIAFDNSTQQIEFGQGATIYRKTTQVFRDPSAWYHILLMLDTTQATANDRVKLYLNGIQITAFGTLNNPTQNADLACNNNVAHSIGADITNTSARNYFNGYLTEIHFVDGQALTADDFGETDATTGVWKPKAYAGTYGTNGFYLPFSDNTSTTTLGYDESGNNNDWTLTNFLLSGAGNDSLVDTPTPYGEDTGAGGEVRGNYCTLNPLDVGGTVTLSNGNLNAVGAATRYCNVRSTTSVASGKWYWEVTITTQNTDNPFVGIFEPQTSIGALEFTSTSTGWGMCCGTGTNNGKTYHAGTGSSSYTTFAANDVCMVALDMDNQKIWWGKNGTWLNSSDPEAGTNALYSSIGSNPKSPAVLVNTSGTALNINFGQRPFAYTAPSGFKALCTQNLPDPTIVQGDDYFNTVLYTGTGASQSITGVGFQPDWVWIKKRSAAANHIVTDAVRGNTKQLRSNETSAESTITDMVTAFGSDGFTLGADTNNGVNENAATFAAWNWYTGGSNATNTDGTITSTVRANPTAGFSIVTYTGTGSAATIGHGLGAAPSVLLVKERDNANQWHCGFAALGFTQYIHLDLANAKAASSAVFNNTAPTSSVFSVGTSSGTNRSGGGMVAYCFAEVEGYSKFGSYTGNGSADGPFVYCGFRPAWIMIKRSDSATNGNWLIKDIKRGLYNPDGYSLLADVNNAEFSPSNTLLDELSNGFKARDASNTINASGSVYIFMAFAENPFKYSLAR